MRTSSYTQSANNNHKNQQFKTIFSRSVLKIRNHMCITQHTTSHERVFPLGYTFLGDVIHNFVLNFMKNLLEKTSKMKETMSSAVSGAQMVALASITNSRRFCDWWCSYLWYMWVTMICKIFVVYLCKMWWWRKPPEVTTVCTHSHVVQVGCKHCCISPGDFTVHYIII